MKTTEVLNRIGTCRYVDDTELKALHDKLLELQKLLEDFSPIYDLALWDVNRKIEQLRNMMDARIIL
jgi:hypothetical protein